MTRRIAAATLAATVLLASACGTGTVNDSKKSSPTISIEIVDGAPVGGLQSAAVKRGDSTTLSVTGNSSDRVHIHGYDLYVELDEGRGSVTFDALIPGVFEVELEQSGRRLLDLTVS